jgi:tetratricopeptide (TPR) repeat protein
MLQTEGSRSDKLSSVDVSISLSLGSISMQQNPEAVQLLSVVSCLPDGLLNWEINLSSVAKGFDHAEHAITILIKLALIYLTSNGTLKVLSPIRHHMLDKYPANPIQIQHLEAHYIAMINKHGQHDDYGPTFTSSKDILLPENGNITALFKSAFENHPYEELGMAAYLMASFLSRTQPSTELLDMLFDKLENVDLATMRARCFSLKGNILSFLCQFDQATYNIEEAWQLFTQMEDQYNAASCLWSLGDILYRQDKYGEAQGKLEEAQEIFKQLGDLPGQSNCLKSLGDVLVMQGKYLEAQEKLEKALDMIKQTEDVTTTASCLQGLGNVLYMLDRYSEAQEKLEQAQSIFEKIGNTAGATFCLRELGDILVLQARYPEALHKLEQARETFEQIGYLAGATSCLQKNWRCTIHAGKVFRCQREAGRG